MQVPCIAMELQVPRTGMASAAAMYLHSMAVPNLRTLNLSNLCNVWRNAACSLNTTRRGHVVAVSKVNEVAEVEEDEGKEEEDEQLSEEDTDEEFSDDDELIASDDSSDSEATASSQEGEIERTLPSRPRGSWKSIFPTLGQKERKELRGHAHRLGKDIVLQHIGKAGVTANTITCLSDALEKNELMKVKVLNNCPEEMNQIVFELEDGLEAQVVGKIGHVLVLYRPSLRKAEAEERKLELARMMRKKRRFTRQRRR